MNSFFIAVAVHSFFAFHDIPAQPQKEYWLNDTTINHSLDGKADEWSAQKFEIDPATQFKYAIDNDKQNLYLVLSIANFREQIKIIRQGMDLYFDPKEKKKEGKGIEFPVKKDPSAADMVMNYGGQENGNTEEQSPEQRKAAMRKIRAEMALS